MSQLLLVLFFGFFSDLSLWSPNPHLSGSNLYEGSPSYVETPLPFSLPSEPAYLVWQKRRPLQWHDFKGRPEYTNHIHAAVTYAGLDVQLQDDGPIRFRVEAVFDPQLSWVHPKKKDPQLLAHEQLHFDITEVYARKLENKLNSLNNKRDRKKIKELIADYKQLQLNAQAQYDKESLHGIRQESQQAWRMLIDRELQQPSYRLFLRPHQK